MSANITLRDLRIDVPLFRRQMQHAAQLLEGEVPVDTELLTGIVNLLGSVDDALSEEGHYGDDD